MNTSDALSADRLGRDLSAYLAGQYGAPIEIRDLRRLTGGTSHQTWSFDLVSLEQQSAQPKALILRCDFSEDQLDLDLVAEFSLLQRLFAAGVPVPEPLLCESGKGALGTAFIISERLAGADIRKRMAAGRNGARELGLELTGILARIHQLDWRRVLDGGSQTPRNAAKNQVERWSAIALGAQQAPSPLLSAAVEWLLANIPEPARCTLVHGDFKANNLVFDATGRVAVIDWELSHLGDPLEDLAFTMLWTSKYDLVGGMLSAEEFLEAYEAASGTAVDRERLFFWQMFAQVKIAAIFLKGISHGSGGQFPRPSLIQLGRALPWIEQRISELLREDLIEKVAA